MHRVFYKFILFYIASTVTFTSAVMRTTNVTGASDTVPEADNVAVAPLLKSASKASTKVWFTSIS